MGRKKILETMKERPIVGDGSYVITLEKRGYVKAGPYTPECVIEHPDAVKQLHLEFLRAGSDVIQAFTFYASDGKLNREEGTKHYTSDDLNQAACDIARSVVEPGEAFICGGISPTPTYDSGHGDKEAVKKEFRKQIDVFKKNNLDFLLGEFFPYVNEAELAVEVMKEAGVPVAVTTRVGPTGDRDDVSPGDCAVRLARAGADIVGINCSFDPATCIKTIRMMKMALDDAGLSPFLMLQPVGYHCPDAEDAKDGYHVLPEFPFGLEPRILTRWDVRRYAREAYEAGVRYIGGCCGFESYHIREIAEELASEIGHRPPGQDKHVPWAMGLLESTWPSIKANFGWCSAEGRCTNCIRSVDFDVNLTMGRKTILETMKERPIVGDGSYVVTLEKRGYVKAGPFTPECILEYPDGVKQLHYEFLRGGADVIQAFSFYATDGKLNSAEGSKNYTSGDLNQAACDIARSVAEPGGAFICGGISPTPSYDHGHGDKEAVKQEFRKQIDIFKKNKVDFLLGEFFAFVDEAELAVEVMKEASVPIAVTLRVGPTGDHDNVSPGECAVRLARAGADIVGINCSFDPTTCINTVRMMKKALDDAGLSPFLMLQPVGYHCPDAEDAKDGYHVLPEFPFALEPRVLTRWDARKYARLAYEAGVRYIGGCCGFEPYHIREIAEELAPEIGHRPLGQDKHVPWAMGLSESTWPSVRSKADPDFWRNLEPSTGRCFSASLSKTKNDWMRQHKS